jgi:hypothetical protein
MDQATMLINSYPPATGYLSMDMMVSAQRNWIVWIITGAMAQAAMALTFNWVADEFSLAGETLVTVRVSGGQEIQVSMEELYALQVEAEAHE